jgi:hypothetical protein
VDPFTFSAYYGNYLAVMLAMDQDSHSLPGELASLPEKFGFPGMNILPTVSKINFRARVDPSKSLRMVAKSGWRKPGLFQRLEGGWKYRYLVDHNFNISIAWGKHQP